MTPYEIFLVVNVSLKKSKQHLILITNTIYHNMVHVLLKKKKGKHFEVVEKVVVNYLPLIKCIIQYLYILYTF